MSGEKLKVGEGQDCQSLVDATEGKLFIIAKRIGRLANRLTLFANFIAYAEEYGHSLVNTAFYDDAHFFGTTCKNVCWQYPEGRNRNFSCITPGVAGVIRRSQILYQTAKTFARLHERCPVFGERVVTLRDIEKTITMLEGAAVRSRIASASVVLIHGWNFRAPKPLKSHAGKIRRFFRPKNEYLTKGRLIVDQLRLNADIVIGVHVRHGDYALFRDGKYFFSTSRYAAWMHELREQFPGKKVSFLVCSDEQRHESEFPMLPVCFGPGTPMGDLYALAECDYILGPLSTFSQWASYYGAKPLLLMQGENESPDLERFQISWLDHLP